jgi:hypothetical protein
MYKGVTKMANIVSTPVTKTFEYRDERIDPSFWRYSATWNGKRYGNKRYINVSYRVNNTKSGLKQYTCIWQDGFGWLECPLGGDTLIELFGLE